MKKKENVKIIKEPKNGQNWKRRCTLEKVFFGKNMFRTGVTFYSK